VFGKTYPYPIQHILLKIVTIELEPGQVLRAESGAMMYMTDGVTMNTTTGGGLSTGFQRMLTGQNMFISDYLYEGKPGTVGTVALGTDFPSKIIRLNVEEYGGKLVCQKGALLCASHTSKFMVSCSLSLPSRPFLLIIRIAFGKTISDSSCPNHLPLEQVDIAMEFTKKFSTG